MAEMSVIWLRVAAAFYSLGLLHAILTLVRRREHLFRVALTAFTVGTVFHFVSIVEEGIVNNRCPIANFYETLVDVRLPGRGGLSWRAPALSRGKPQRLHLSAGLRHGAGRHPGQSR